MFVAMVARAPEALQRGHRRDACAAGIENARELADRGSIVVEMLARFPGRHAGERVRAERQLRHVADDRGDAEGPSHVERRFERIVDPEDVVAALLHASRELSEADGSVEDARAARELVDLAQDDAEAIFVSRAEHLGLRAPGVSVHATTIASYSAA